MNLPPEDMKEKVRVYREWETGGRVFDSGSKTSMVSASSLVTLG
jgi:hypothetical protein